MTPDTRPGQLFQKKKCVPVGQLSQKKVQGVAVFQSSPAMSRTVLLLLMHHLFVAAADDVPADFKIRPEAPETSAKFDSGESNKIRAASTGILNFQTDPSSALRYFAVAHCDADDEFIHAGPLQHTKEIIPRRRAERPSASSKFSVARKYPLQSCSCCCR